MSAAGNSKGPERERDLPREAYFSEDYFTYEQLWSLVDQLFHVYSMRVRNVLEVGVGNGFVADFLRSAGFNVTTVDINPKLNPDIVASVLDMDRAVPAGCFDLVSCCEVLEHLPFEDFESSIRTFSSLADKLFLTLPLLGKKYGFGGFFNVPKIRSRWVGAWIKVRSRKCRMADEHWWELDSRRECSRKSVAGILGRYYDRVDEGFLKANPYHYYFECCRSA